MRGPRPAAITPRPPQQFPGQPSSIVRRWFDDGSTNCRAGTASGSLAARKKVSIPPIESTLRRTMESKEKAAAKERQGTRTNLDPTCAKVSHKSKERAADKIAAFAGVSGRTVEKIGCPQQNVGQFRFCERARQGDGCWEGEKAEFCKKLG